jgi:hypothetical protein
MRQIKSGSEFLNSTPNLLLSLSERRGAFFKRKDFKLGKVEREISPGEVADLSILRQAQNELGIEGK